jgi:hypothetical protein
MKLDPTHYRKSTDTWCCGEYLELKRDKVTREWKKQQNWQLHNL